MSAGRPSVQPSRAAPCVPEVKYTVAVPFCGAPAQPAQLRRGADETLLWDKGKACECATPRGGEADEVAACLAAFRRVRARQTSRLGAPRCPPPIAAADLALIPAGAGTAMMQGSCPSCPGRRTPANRSASRRCPRVASTGKGKGGSRSVPSSRGPQLV